MSFNVEVEGGTSVRLPTAGKYCDRDIVITATGGEGGSYDEGYEAGKQAEYDRFWDAFQLNGTRTDYYVAFNNAYWNDDSLRPKYPITCTNASSISARSTFYNSSITKILVPVVVTGVSMQDMFSRCSKLENIAKLVLNGVTSFTNTFASCSSLKHITIEGSIDVNISFANSDLLTTASVQSIIDRLKDLTGATAQTLTFHATVGAKLTAEQKATITAKNWTLVY